MFSAIKRLAQKNDNNNAAKPQSHQTMSSSLQRKFARGIQYNMKIIIKGDRNVGKTCLFHRLQGNKFIEEYIPTDEIQVTSIQWSHGGVDDVVKVEVWDVVDKGKKKKQFNGLKLENSSIDIPEETALDAEFLDVYKGTNGVILMMDLTKTWTFDYVQRELPKVPHHIPVIILANHCDMSHHRTVTPEHINYFIESVSSGRSQVRYCESSMRNGFGLKILHKFFSLPFLQLQKESLLVQLKKNETETRNTINELDAYIESDEANYDKFLEKLTSQRREVAEKNTNIIPRSDITISAQHSPQEIKSGIVKSPVKLDNSASLSVKSPSTPQSLAAKMNINIQDGVDAVAMIAEVKKTPASSAISVDEFCPDGGQLDKSFLEDDTANNYSQKPIDEMDDGDNEVDNGNPMVANFQDYIDSDDDFKLAKRKISSEPFPKPEFSIVNAETLDVAEAREDVDVTKPDTDDSEDTFHPWMSTDSKWRTSPEGGEDVPGFSQLTDSYSTANNNNKLVYSSLTSDTDNDNSAIKKDESSDEKHKKKEKSKKSEKQSKSKNSKEKKDKSKRKSKTESDYQNELEEFLNGTNEPKVQVAYEAI